MEEIKKIKRTIKNMIRDSFRIILGKKIYTKLRFFLTHGYKLNLQDPKTWNEKIQYRKFNCNNNELANYVDKFKVREYIKAKGFEKNLIPLLGVYDKITEKTIEEMPESFVIKTSNGGGGENVKIVSDKNLIDVKELCNQFNGYLKTKQGNKVDENFYDFIEPKIIFEELLLDQDKKIPNDYKLHCFRRKDNFTIFIQVDEGRFINHKRSIYDEKMKKCKFRIQPKYEEINQEILDIKNFKEMIRIAKGIFPDNYNYVRIDLYNLNGKIYFGEMTFAHGSGFEAIKPREWDLKFGELWEIEKLYSQNK